MANFVYTQAAAELLKGTLDFDLPNDIRVFLAMTNTTCDTERDVTTNAGFTTLDEFDGSGYTAGGGANGTLANEAVNVDTGNDRGEFDADDITFSSIGAGTRAIQGCIVYKFISNFNGSLPIAWIEDGGFPFTANGGNLIIAWNTQGIIQATTT